MRVGAVVFHAFKKASIVFHCVVVWWGFTPGLMRCSTMSVQFVGVTFRQWVASLQHHPLLEVWPCLALSINESLPMIVIEAEGCSVTPKKGITTLNMRAPTHTACFRPTGSLRPAGSFGLQAASSQLGDSPFESSSGRYGSIQRVGENQPLPLSPLH